MNRTLTQLGLIFSFFVLAGEAYAVPGQPTIVAPTSGETVNTTVAFVQWTGDAHTLYQVQVNSQNLPDTGIIYDSQLVSSTRFFAWSGILSNNSTYYAFIRLGTVDGWGPWSTGRTFSVDTAFVPAGINYVRVQGNSLVNNSGPFLGLGFSYFRALQRCRADRPRYQSDLAFMSSKGFNYQRILSMVSWQGVEIAPVAFGSVPAWADYDQQFKDMIDIAYDSYGIKTEVTIFADAQNVMPNDSTRMAHLDRLLADLVGREHKVVLLEVGNELYQNGLPDPNDVRAKGLYLANHTPIPVALSAPADGSDAGIVAYYGGSAADITTVHLDRNINTVEGGWLPVRDSYRTGISSIAPMSSNEPIGPGSSVASETDPIKLCMAACFAWTANLPSYVYHCKAGIQGWTNCCPPSGTEKFFSTSEGVTGYMNILPLLPGDLASWERNDGKVVASPFTNYSMGQADKWWTEVGGSTNGCVRNIAATKGNQFVTCAIGILSGGLELAARRPMNLQVYNPLTGTLAYNLTKNTSDHFTLAQGPGAYVIIGTFTGEAETPYTGTPVNIPGTLQAEDFDNGGEGLAYHDTDAPNNGGQYRLSEGVDIETTTDTGGGFDVTGIAATEYLNYQINVVSAGNYDISLRVASAVSGGTYHIEINSVNVTGSKNFAATGGGQTWITTTVPNIAMGTGVQTLRVVMESAGWNLNHITLSWSGGALPVIVTIKDTTPSGNSASVRDSYLRKIGDPPEAAGADDTNGGAVSGNGTRMYPDVGPPSGKAPRHNLIWFDLSGIPAGSTINSASYGFFLTSVSGPSITAYKLSRLNTGKDWIEGLGGTTTTANAGEPTWSSRKHNDNPAWASPGASGAADVDLGTTMTWNKTAGVSETIALNVTSWVNDWVNNGVQNNGMLMWGGTGPGGANNYFWLVTSEDTTTPDLRPYLTINYTLPVCATPTINTNSPVCPNTNSIATITNPVGGGAYSWNITGGTFAGNVTTTTGNPVTWSASSAGTVTITATQTGPSGGCTGSAAGNAGSITVNALPACSITGTDPVCPGSNNTYYGPASMDTYAWSISGQGTIDGAANGASVSVDAGASGSFTLDLTVTQNGCSSQCSVPFNVVACNSPNFTVWRSVRTHAGVGEQSILLNATASGNGASGPTVETRGVVGSAAGPGVQKIQVDFSAPITLSDGGNVTVTYRVTTPGFPATMGGPISTVPTSVALADADTLDILFAVNQIPNMTCININIGPGTLTQTITGDTDCNIRSLAADTNTSGTVTIADQSQTKANIGQPIPPAQRFDFNLSGGITITDQSFAKAQNVTPTKTALCP